MDRKRFIKEKARYAFIRERTRKIRERPRHRIAVPGLDYAEDIQGRDASEPGEREAAVDRTEDMAISSLGYTEKALKYAKRKYRENVSHRETHFESGGASAAAAEDIPEMCFTVRHISKVETAYPGAKELLREKAVEEYKAGQIQKGRYRNRGVFLNGKTGQRHIQTGKADRRQMYRDKSRLTQERAGESKGQSGLCPGREQQTRVKLSRHRGAGLPREGP